MSRTSTSSVESWARDLGLAGLSSVLLLSSYPRWDVDILAWIALIPLLIAFQDRSPKQCFLLAHVTGILFMSGLLHWILTVPSYNLLDFLLIQFLYLPLYLGLWGLGFASIRKYTHIPAYVIAPTLWVTLEYVRTNFGFLSFPWMLLGHTQYSHVWLIQISSVTGVYGLSFLIVLVNVVLAGVLALVLKSVNRPVILRHLEPCSRLPLLVTVSLFLGVVLYGFSVVEFSDERERLRVAVIQGNIPLANRWDHTRRVQIVDHHVRLTSGLSHEHAPLIVWPETAVPGDVEHDPTLQGQVAQTAARMNAFLLVGSAEFAKFTDKTQSKNYYNNMILFSPEGQIIGQYRKMVLVPFAEYAPLQGYVKWPKAIVAASGTNLPGTQYTLFSVNGARFGTVICWENIFPDHFRQFVKRGAQFMVSATNEAWFGETAAPYQLLVMTVFRAVENRVSIARAGNSGISAFIDPYGRITQRLQDSQGKDLFMEGTLTGEVMLSKARTFYTLYGDVFAFATILACALLLAQAFRAMLRRSSFVCIPPSVEPQRR